MLRDLLGPVWKIPKGKVATYGEVARAAETQPRALPSVVGRPVGVAGASDVLEEVAVAAG